MPIQALEIQHLLTHVTLPPLRHPHHTIDAFDCTTGSHRLTQQFIHLDITRFPIGAKSTTKHAGHRHQLTPMNTVVTLGLLLAPEHVPQMDQGVASPRRGDGRAPLLMQAIHMTQRPRIAQHPFCLLPAVTLKSLHRLVELRLSWLASIKMPGGLKPPQCLFDLLHRLLGLHRLIKKPLGLSPGATRMARPPSRVLPAPLGLLPFRLRFDRRLTLTLHAVPPVLYDPPDLPLGVKNIEPH